MSENPRYNHFFRLNQDTRCFQTAITWATGPCAFSISAYAAKDVPIRQFPSLHALMIHFSTLGITNDFLRAQPQLEELHVDKWNDITDRGLEGLLNLHTLSIRSNGVISQKTLLNLPSLTSLNVEMNKCALPLGTHIFQKLKHLSTDAIPYSALIGPDHITPKLTRLRLSTGELDPDYPLYDTNETLEYLSLGLVTYSTPPWSKLRRLRKLEISNTDCRSLLKYGHEMTDLVSLSVGGDLCMLNDETLSVFCHIKELSLSMQNLITDVSISKLEALEIFSLAGSPHVTHRSIVALKNLKKLILSKYDDVLHVCVEEVIKSNGCCSIVKSGQILN